MFGSRSYCAALDWGLRVYGFWVVGSGVFGMSSCKRVQNQHIEKGRNAHARLLDFGAAPESWHLSKWSEKHFKLFGFLDAKTFGFVHWPGR